MLNCNKCSAPLKGGKGIICHLCKKSFHFSCTDNRHKKKALSQKEISWVCNSCWASPASPANQPPQTTNLSLPTPQKAAAPSLGELLKIISEQTQDDQVVISLEEEETPNPPPETPIAVRQPPPLRKPLQPISLKETVATPQNLGEHWQYLLGWTGLQLFWWKV